MKNEKKKTKPYSKYFRVFGMNLKEIKDMPRVEFSQKFGTSFKYMSQSKFLKQIDKIATAYERGKEILGEYE